MEIEQTASPLETNAHTNYFMAEYAAYICIENGGGKRAHIDMFMAHCACLELYLYKVMDLDGSLENMPNVFSVSLDTRTLSNGTMNGGN